MEHFRISLAYRTNGVLTNLGAEPGTGYASTPLSLPEGYLQGLEYFLTGDGGPAGDGLLGYLNPDTYLQALNNDIGILTNPNNLAASLPLLGFLGLGENSGALAPGSFLGAFGPDYFKGPFDATLFSNLLDPQALLGSGGDFSSILPGAADLTALMPNAADFTGLLGNAFDPAALLSAFDPSSLLTAIDPGSLAGDLGGVATNLGGSLVPDLALNLLTSII